MGYVYIYARDAEDLDCTGLCGALLATECTHEEIAGGMSAVTLVHPFDEGGKWKHIKRGCILKCDVRVRTTPEIEGGQVITSVEEWTVRDTATKAQRYVYSKATKGRKKKLLKAGTSVVVVKKGKERYKIKTGKTSGWIAIEALKFDLNEVLSGGTDGIEDAAPPWIVRSQLFRIQDVDADTDNGTVTAYAPHISYDLQTNVTSYKNAEPLSAPEALDGIADGCDFEHEFEFYTDIGDERTSCDWDNVSPVKALLDPDEGFLTRWGAELVRDDFELYFLRRAGRNRGARIEYGKNLLGVTYQTSDANVVTAIKPTGTKKSGALLYLTDDEDSPDKGFADDVVKTKVAGRGWTGWSYLPFVDYKQGAVTPEPSQEFGARALQYGDEGDDVEQLQTFLIGAGYSCGDHGNGGVDGDFGEDTRSALLAWQYDNGLPETGVCDEDDFAAIARATNPDPEDDPDPGEDGSEPEAPRCVTVTDGNTVHVRTAPSTSGAKRGIAYRGDSFEYAGETEDNGWHKILFNGSAAWISGLYTTLADAPVSVDTPDEKDIAKVLVVDLDQHSNLKNKKIKWDKVLAAVDFVILRCGVTRTETAPIGIGKDDDFAYVAKILNEHGKPFWVYYYGKVKTAAKAREEAEMAFKIASPYGPIGYYYDIEETRLTDACIKAFIERLRELGAKKVGRYIAHHLYTKHKATTKYSDTDWIPRYGKNTGKYDPKYKPAFECDVHQFTSVGKVEGMTDSTLDLNRLTGRKPLSYFTTK